VTDVRLQAERFDAQYLSMRESRLLPDTPHPGGKNTDHRVDRPAEADGADESRWFVTHPNLDSAPPEPLDTTGSSPSRASLASRASEPGSTAQDAGLPVAGTAEGSAPPVPEKHREALDTSGDAAARLSAHSGGDDTAIDGAGIGQARHDPASGDDVLVAGPSRGTTPTHEPEPMEAGRVLGEADVASIGEPLDGSAAPPTAGDPPRPASDTQTELIIEALQRILRRNG
jgi:hypothetical protein